MAAEHITDDTFEAAISGSTPTVVDFWAAEARRSPRARLYSRVPRSSQWPSMVMVSAGLAFRKPAWRSSVPCALPLSAELS